MLQRSLLATAVTAVFLVPSLAFAQQKTMQAGPPVAIDADDIGGVVRGPRGAEAGVWVIAETRDLPTRFIRIVVTDDEGRYVVPDLPKAKYNVWVRGYGLVDSKKVVAQPGKQLNLTAVPAPSERAAAQYYPAIHWYSMLDIPPEAQFGKPPMPQRLTQADWLRQMKNIGCIGCHQIGQQSTRTIPKEFAKAGDSVGQWMRRLGSGHSGEQMIGQLAGEWNSVPFKYYAAWSDRIAKGELPATKPERPQGAERNLVVTMWEWSRPDKYLHDLISSDKRNPTVNGYGPLYGSTEYSTDLLPILDPVKNTVREFRAPVRDKEMPLSLGPGHAASLKPLQPSAYWGDRAIWDTRVNNHNSMLDQKGRVWLAAAIRGAENPAYCRKGSDHPSAKVVPMDRAVRHLAVWDPKSNDYKFVDTCFGTHHLQFDANDRLWTSGGGPVVGWVDMKVFDETGDAAKAQGWTPLILDTNGNGRRDAWTEPKEPADPAKDRRIIAGFYAVMPSPADGSVWGSVGVFGPGAGLVRLTPGSNPSETALAEVFYVPKPGYGIRGADIDKQGVVWASLSSGHLASFDRRKCKGALNGPTATGNHCPEGWSFHQYPGPGFKGIGENSAESSYYTWVDQHNTLGLGEDVPVSTANLNDGLVALKDGKMVSLKIPYPLGFYAKGLDGRIDDPNAGWKGRGIWTTSGDRTPWLKEGGKGTKPLAVHFQMRPDPLAK